MDLDINDISVIQRPSMACRTRGRVLLGFPCPFIPTYEELINYGRRNKLEGEKKMRKRKDVKREASGIKKHVGKLLIYMDDERKDYENMLEDDEDAEDHIWLDIKAIGDWIGITPDDALKASMEETYKILEESCIGMKKFDPDSALLIPIADEKGRFQLCEAKQSQK